MVEKKGLPTPLQLGLKGYAGSKHAGTKHSPLSQKIDSFVLEKRIKYLKVIHFLVGL